MSSVGLAAPLRAQAYRRIAMSLAALVIFLVFWEVVKALVPADGVTMAGVRVLPRTGPGALPHVWSVISVFGEPEVNLPGSQSVIAGIASAGWFTFKLAFAGLVVGTVIGIVLAIAMHRFALAERAMIPYVIASQTVPLVALAPLINGWSGKIAIASVPWTSSTSVIAIAAYLAFFPVTLGMVRGLSAPTRQSVELMHCYNASWWATLIRLRFPVAVGHLLPSLRLAAAAAVVGSIVAEISTATTGGIGRTIIEYAQQSSGDASRLFCAVIGAAVVGLLMTALVSLLTLVLRRYTGNMR